MSYLKALWIALAAISALVQAAPLQTNERATLIESIPKSVVRALNYSQGDRESLFDAQDDFTADGWREFMKRMDGWLDSKGAPLGSSSFTPSGDAVLKDQENGLLHLTIPGTLRQSANKSVTTYRVVVEVRLTRSPIKIDHLEPVVRLPR